MTKYILVCCFFFSIISSCKCNKGANDNAGDEAMLSGNPLTTAVAAAADDSSANAANKADGTEATSMDNKEQNKNELYKKGHNRERLNSQTPGYFPEGSDRLLTNKDLEYLTEWGLAVMKNEIYARHGMIFDPGMLKDHFERQPWYHGTSTSVRNKLTSTERSNLYFIENYKYKPDSPGYDVNDGA